jgi:tetratricopeptide (TPR) repeat protein
VGAGAAYDAAEPELATPDQVAYGWLGRAALASLEARWADGLVAVERALEIGRRHGLASRALTAESVRISLLLQRGDLETAKLYTASALERAEAQQAPSVTLRLQGHRAAIACAEGDSATYVAICRSLVESHRQAGRTLELCTWSENLGMALLLDGQEEAAAAVLAELVALAEGHGLVRSRARALSQLGVLLLRQRPAEALALLEEAVAKLEGLDLVDPLCGLARALHALGRAGEAEQVASRAVRLAQALGIRPDSLHGRQLAEIYMQTSMPDARP